MQYKRYFWVWTAVVAVLIVFAAWVVFWKVGNPSKSTVVADVSFDQLPAGFPPNVPFEQGALIVSNSNAATQNGQLQATRSFKSFKAAAQNISLYADFLANRTNGWTVIASSTDSSGDVTMVARNDEGLLTIRVSPIPPQPMPASLVEITYVTNQSPAVAATSSAK